MSRACGASNAVHNSCGRGFKWSAAAGPINAGRCSGTAGGSSPAAMRIAAAVAAAVGPVHVPALKTHQLEQIRNARAVSAIKSKLIKCTSSAILTSECMMFQQCSLRCSMGWDVRFRRSDLCRVSVRRSPAGASISCSLFFFAGEASSCWTCASDSSSDDSSLASETTECKGESS